MVDLKAKELCILIRQKGNKESGKSIYFYFLFFCTLFFPHQEKKARSNWKNFHHIHNFLVFIFRMGGIWLDWWCWLEFKWWYEEMFERFLFFLFLLLAPFKIQCFGNLALWNQKINHTAKSPKQWKLAFILYMLYTI